MERSHIVTLLVLFLIVLVVGFIAFKDVLINNGQDEKTDISNIQSIRQSRDSHMWKK